MKESEREIQGRRFRSHRTARKVGPAMKRPRCRQKTGGFVGEKREFSPSMPRRRGASVREERGRGRDVQNFRKGEVEHFALRPGAAHRGGELS